MKRNINNVFWPTAALWTMHPSSSLRCRRGFILIFPAASTAQKSGCGGSGQTLRMKKFLCVAGCHLFACITKTKLPAKFLLRYSKLEWLAFASKLYHNIKSFKLISIFCHPPTIHPTSFSFLIFLNVYFFFLREIERQSESRGGAERVGDTESKAGSRLWALSPEPDVGHELTNGEIMTWTEVRRLIDSATQAPSTSYFFLMFIYLFIYLFSERERGRERWWETRQAPCSAQSPAQYHDPDIMARAEIKSRMLNRLSHPGAPIFVNFILFVFRL